MPDMRAFTVLLILLLLLLLFPAIEMSWVCFMLACTVKLFLYRYVSACVMYSQTVLPIYP